MLKRIKTLIHSMKHFKSDEIFQQPTVAIEDVQRHVAPFSALQQCPMRPHAADCEIIRCIKNPCFIRVPDRHVRKKIVTVESVRQDMIKRRAKKKSYYDLQ